MIARNPSLGARDHVTAGTWAKDRTSVALWMTVILMLITFFAIAANQWYMAQSSPPAEISRIMNVTEEACRPILRLRLHDTLLHQGRPLTRRETNAVSDSIRDCASIAAQMTAIDAK